MSLRYVFSNYSPGRPFYRGDPFNVHAFRTKDNACIVLDGSEVIFASEAERFSHIKHDFQPPTLALEAFKRHNLKYDGSKLEEFDTRSTDPRDHHLHHIYECFYQSGFHEAAILVNDGCGTKNDCITLAYIKEGEEPIILKKYSSKKSPCLLYSEVSATIFGHQGSEGKFMGLSAYGKDIGKSHKYIYWDENKQEPYVDFEATRKDLAICKSGEDWAEQGVMAARDIAYTIQKGFEEVLVESAKVLAQLLKKRNIKTENLAMSGGGILNCPANSKIVDLGLFEHYYASPQPSDGCAESIGATYKKMQEQGKNLKSYRLKTAYLGCTYPFEDAWRLGDFKTIKNAKSNLCKHLTQGGIIAWYQGGAEYGPRALGHRSFLADPTNKEMLDTLNRVKGREDWRPLAPIVPDRLFPLIFEETNTDMCEFMLRTLTIKEKWQPKLKAVCHVDGTTRPQLLKREVNPQLYDLLLMYFEETHVPCLVNTSLNINGFPIVETPTDLCCLSQEILLTNNTVNLKTVIVEDKKVIEVKPYRE